jgi:hypothetical protein
LVVVSLLVEECVSDVLEDVEVIAGYVVEVGSVHGLPELEQESRVLAGIGQDKGPVPE